jgi:dimethylargininase
VNGYGCQGMTATLRRVLVRPPRAENLAAWRDYGWRGEPDAAGIAREHEAFCELLASGGAEMIVADTPADGNPDSILLNPGKAGRRGEPAALGRDLEAAGVPVAARLDGEAFVEGGDTCWLDGRTLLAGRGYRTNDAGIAALAEALPGVEVIAFDLPHFHGAGEVLHLMSLISPVDVDLAVVYLPLMPVRLAELLAERGTRLIEVPGEEFETMGANVLALAPRVALALAGNPVTRGRMEAAGVDVLVYAGDELSRKGDGGPTCLTRPVLRAP